MMRTLSTNELAAYGRQCVTMRVASRSDVGLVRANNEDTVVLADLASGDVLASGALRKAGALVGVCDGMGGAAAGEVASRIAAEVVKSALTSVPHDVDAGQLVAAVRGAVHAAGDAVKSQARRDVSRKGMGTTCTVAVVRGGLMVVAHVGDSRLYLLRGGELRQLTRDQTWENEMLAQGRLKESELGELERGKAIVQAVGTTEQLKVEMIALELYRDDVVLLCSDGLSGMVSDAAIHTALQRASDPEEASDELVRLALQEGGRDNVSLVVARFEGRGLRAADDVGAAGAVAPHIVSTARWRTRGPIFAAIFIAVTTGLVWMATPSAPHEGGALPRRVSSPPNAASSTQRHSPAQQRDRPPAPRVDLAANADRNAVPDVPVTATQRDASRANEGAPGLAPATLVKRSSVAKGAGGRQRESPVGAVEISRPAGGETPF